MRIEGFRLLSAAVLSAVLPFGSVAGAQDYPAKPVKIIVNVAPGGGVDTATRIVGEKLRLRLGQPFVIENRPGGGGNIGAEVVFHSEPDGYTLLSSSPSPLAINGWLYKKLGFDPAGFEPVESAFATTDSDLSEQAGTQSSTDWRVGCSTP